MTIAAKIPSVLQQPHGNSLSIERVLERAIKLLDYVEAENGSGTAQYVIETQEDLRTILKNLDR